MISIPIDNTTSANDIKEKMTAIAEMFQKQEATWVQRFTIQEMRKNQVLADPNDETYDVDMFVAYGWYYDPESKKFYHSEEQYQKAMEK